MADSPRRFVAWASPGVWTMVVLACVSSAAVLLLPAAPREKTQFWIFAKQHREIYDALIARWNRTHPENRVEMSLVNIPVMEQRMMSGFLTGTPMADVVEVERLVAGRAFTGPLDQVGFVDLTDRLKSECLFDGINAPSFSPWTSRGRIFGLPHDVHPVLLMYRADLVEAAGIDVSKIETWDDYFRLLRPLMRDLDGDGRVDRYLLNASPSDPATTELLLLQAGGAVFDEQERPTLTSRANARALARLVPWHAGPARACRWSDVVTTASGQQTLVDGLVVAVLTPDWLSGHFKKQVPNLAGKIKVMPLPAWERGGRRTSVWGGTMLGIAKNSPHVEADWEFAKAIYLSQEMAVELYRSTNIVSPIKAHWMNPVYDEPDPYFSGQPVGRLYLQQAPDVPRRPASPYNTQAIRKLTNCLTLLVEYARQHQLYDPAALEPEAQRLLDDAQCDVERQIERNVFLSGDR
jgi:arabinosaccharide transport system substrate-binding protein